MDLDSQLRWMFCVPRGMGEGLTEQLLHDVQSLIPRSRVFVDVSDFYILVSFSCARYRPESEGALHTLGVDDKA